MAYINKKVESIVKNQKKQTIIIYAGNNIVTKLLSEDNCLSFLSLELFKTQVYASPFWENVFVNCTFWQFYI